MDIEREIMEYKQYLKQKVNSPYVYKINKGGQNLTYFGVRHSFEIDDPQWKDLKIRWSGFMEKAKSEKADVVVMVEGGLRPVEEDGESAIKKWGDPGLVVFLAANEGTKVISPEPTMKTQAERLLNKFSKEEVEYYYFARMVGQWSRHGDDRPEFEGYVRNSLNRDKLELGWEGFDFSLENMKLIHLSLFGEEFDKNKGEFFKGITNPTLERSIVNKVASECSRIRDERIVVRIEEEWRRGKSIFIVYGFTHAVMQERAIRRVCE